MVLCPVNEDACAVSWSINERLDVERQVVLNLCLEIARGVWMPGDTLPAPNSLAQELILNPHVVESALSGLARSHLLTPTPDGHFRVADQARELAQAHLVKAAGKELRELVHGLRRAGVLEADIQGIWTEAIHD